ncbi:MAG: FAD-dependent protein [Elusimicrobiota bacterium]
MNSKKKVIIVGAGSAGLFAAIKLAGKVDVTVIDKGHDIEERSCQVSLRGQCTKCNPCNIIYGAGGAGLFSDGKLIFNTNIGTNLAELVDKKKVEKLISLVEKGFAYYDITAVEDEAEKVAELKKKAMQHGIDFVHSRQAHIGSDKLSALMIKVRDDLKKSGVKFIFNKEVNNLEPLEYDAIILAPGRGGATWLEEILHSHYIPFTYRPVDIGVRVEVKREIAADIVNISRDMKFYLISDKYNDKVRTFCTCPDGYVDIEAHGVFVLVNGHSDAENSSGNTNFAVLVTIPLTEPLVNTNTYANLIARLFNGLGGQKPILQRLGDIKKGRRSREGNQKKFMFEPTLKDVTYGDITLAMPGRYMESIINAIDRLDSIMPGLANDSTILYGPELKFHGLKVETDEYLCAGSNIYVAGDGAGVSRGIVGAAASGILAAEGVLRKE